MNPFVSSDQKLLRRLAQGDESAFSQLYERHRAYVLNVARRYTPQEDDALDVLQEVFSWLIKRAGTLELRAQLRTLLFPVIRHQALDHARRRRRRREMAIDHREADADFLEQYPAPPIPPEPGQQRSALAELLAGLSASHREVLLLRFVDGLELAEIAEALSISSGTVKSRLHYALAKLREDPRTQDYFDKKENSNPPATPDPGEKS